MKLKTWNKVFVVVTEPTSVADALQQDKWKQSMTDVYLALFRSKYLELG